MLFVPTAADLLRLCLSNDLYSRLHCIKMFTTSLGPTVLSDTLLKYIRFICLFFFQF